ncbi:MAG: bifunctional metallophosphatase/5'-nucleotidase [Propionibacteriaceae bacterium]|nr:bifunctional metallophosphatase/5'-nucleotidase [Propionibacteriaceae bacterium]
MSRFAKKIVVGLAAGVLGLAGTAVSAPVSTAAPNPVPVHIFTFNDFHGHIATAAVPWAYTLEKAALADPDNSMVVSAGDNVGASDFQSAIAQDDPTIQLLNDIAATPGINFQASAVGNHEFDQGLSDLTDRIIGGTNPDGSPAAVKADWTYLAANVIDIATSQPVLDPYCVYTLGNGLRVGVVGAVTIETPGMVSPAGVASVTFTDPVAAVNKYADQLKANNEADIVIAVYHDGAAVVPDATGAPSLDQTLLSSPSFTAMVNNTDANVAAIVNGHTHSTYSWTGSAAEDPQGLDTHPGRPIVQAGAFGSAVGQIDLMVDTDTMTVTSATASTIPAVSADQVDPALGSMQTIIDHIDTALANAEVLGRPTVGYVSSDITTAFTSGSWQAGTFMAEPALTYQNAGSAARDDRANESAMGSLVATSLLDAAQSQAQIGGADLAVVNPGGLRNEFYYGTDGRITYADANNVLPYSNNVWTIDLTGAQVKQLLEEQWQTDATGARPSRPFLALGLSNNVTYTVNTDLGSATPCVLGSCAWDDPNSHVTSVFVNGQPLQADKVYKVITYSFLATGGDQFWVMTQGTDPKDTGLLDRDVWMNYLLAESGMSAPDQTPTAQISPSYARSSVVVTNLSPATAPMQSTVVTAGSTVSATVSRLDLTSLGSPANTALDTFLEPISDPTAENSPMIGSTTVTDPGDTAGCAQAGVSADLNPASNGCARLTAYIPADTVPGNYYLVSAVLPSQTVIFLPITVVAAGQSELPPAANGPTGLSAPTGGTVGPVWRPVAPAGAVLLLAGAWVLVVRVRTRNAG